MLKIHAGFAVFTKTLGVWWPWSRGQVWIGIYDQPVEKGSKSNGWTDMGFLGDEMQQINKLILNWDQ